MRASRTPMLLVLVLCGCDPSLESFTRDKKAQIEETQKSFPKWVSAVQTAQVTPSEACKPPEPLVQATGAAHNAEVITFGALEQAGADRDSYAPWTEVPFGKTGAALETVVRDSHPTMKQYRRPSMKVSAGWRAEYDDAARVKYLVVMRTRAMDRDKGMATVDALLLDAKAVKVLCVMTQELSVGAKLGTEYYKVVRENADGTKTDVRHDSHDLFEDAMFSARSTFADRIQKAWGISVLD